MSDLTLQRDIFVTSEGNGWYGRNIAAFDRPSLLRERIIARVASHLPATEHSTVVEIGCATGINLANLRQVRPIHGIGVDPSIQAIERGADQYPDLRLLQGTADKLPLEDNSVDAIWFGFCLYLVDRSLISRVVAEADRVLKNGGLLVIHDFDPDFPRMRRYAHHNGLWSYKMNYSMLFTANPAYVLVEKTSFSHADLHWNADPQERVGLWFCRKNLQLGYEQS